MLTSYENPDQKDLGFLLCLKFTSPCIIPGGACKGKNRAAKILEKIRLKNFFILIEVSTFAP